MVAIWIFCLCAVGDFALFGFAGLRASALLQRESHCRCTEYNRAIFMLHLVFFFIFIEDIPLCLNLQGKQMFNSCRHLFIIYYGGHHTK